MNKEEIVKNNINIIRKIIKDNIIPVLNNEAGQNVSEQHFSYVQQRAMINQIFKTTSGNNYNKQSIMLRLIVIDSLYSTNAAYSYFSFEDMADKIYDSAKEKVEKEKATADYFYSLVSENSEDGKELFTSSYGIRKNLTKGSRQMSLMSKYAYYVLLQYPDEYPLGFPIYDSLAINMYTEVYKKVKGTKTSKFSKAKLADTKTITIKDYIKALNDLRCAIFKDEDGLLFNGYQQYDLLDAYLWRMGKLDEGNYSLLFHKDEYEKFVENLELNIHKTNDTTDKYNKRIYEKYKEIKILNKKEVKKTSNKAQHEGRQQGTDSEKDLKKYDFNKLVKYECATKSVDTILSGIENPNMKTLIEHWKEFYVNIK